mgnify:CR=1 FL=1
MNRAVPENYKVDGKELELLKKHLCGICETKLDSLEIKDLVSVTHQFCQELSSYKARYSGTGYTSDAKEWEKGRKRYGSTALKAQIKTLRHVEIDNEDYVECMNRAKLYSYPSYAIYGNTNSHAVSELYPLGNGCQEWLKVKRP